MQGSVAECSPQAQRPGIIILISTHIIGGPGKGLLQIVPELVAHRCVRPILCTFHKDGAPHTPFIRACQEHGIEVTLLSQRFNYDPRPYLRLLRLMRDENVQVVQTHGYKENLFGLMLKLLGRKRWISFIHGTTNENIKVRLYHGIDRWVVRHADRIVSVSRELAARHVALACLPKVRIVENAIAPLARVPDPFSVAKFRREHGIASVPVLACVGRLSPEKGQDLLLDAARLLVDAGRRFQVVFVGDGPEREHLERRCDELRLRGHVLFIGAQKRVDLVYALARALVLPSYKEGMPNVVLEAMLHALPIVATRVGAIPEMLEDGETAWLVRPGDARALASALTRALADETAARGLGENARAALFPRFSVARRLEAIEQVYTELGEAT